MNSLLCSLASVKVLFLAYENFAVMIRPSRVTLMEKNPQLLLTKMKESPLKVHS